MHRPEKQGTDVGTPVGATLLYSVSPTADMFIRHYVATGPVKIETDVLQPSGGRGITPSAN